MMILKSSLLSLLVRLKCEGGGPELFVQKMGKIDWHLVCFSCMASTMSYFDLVGDDCMEKIMETSVDQLEDSINIAVDKLRKYADTRYKEETKVKKDTFSMCRLKLAVACLMLETA